jgi:hypothetical protein
VQEAEKTEPRLPRDGIGIGFRVLWESYARLLENPPGSDRFLKGQGAAPKKTCQNFGELWNK